VGSVRGAAKRKPDEADFSTRLQAGIAACHARASRPEHADWKTILGPYEVLGELWPNPVVELNRAVAAMRMVHGPDAALAALEKLAADPRFRDYCYVLAVRAHVLEQAGQHVAARGNRLHAANLTRNERERQLYQNHAQRRSRPCQ
jgi:predicted RNA polymerase sigma factor